MFKNQKGSGQESEISREMSNVVFLHTDQIEANFPAQY